MQATDIDIVADRFGSKNEVILKAMQTHTEGFIALVSNGPQVNVLVLVITPDQFYTDIDELIDRIGERNLQNPT